MCVMDLPALRTQPAVCTVIFTHHTLVWKGIFNIGCCFFLSPVTDISATVALIGVKFCMMVHIGPRQIFSPFGAVPPGTPKSEILGLNFGHLITNISKTVSHRAICQLEPNISSTRAFNKCKSQGGSPPRQGVHPPYDRFVSCSHTCCKITRYMAALVLCRILLPCPDIILHKV